MKLLDLFCGAGGASVGYSQAGFTEIVGVDVVDQPHYPFKFVLADALTFSTEGFDFIHASPPCQAHTTLKSMANVKANGHADLIPQTREKLMASGLPFVIENVPGAPLINPTLFCGTMFSGLGVKRHRFFEANFDMVKPGRCNHSEERNPPRFRTLRHGKWYQSGFCPVYGGGGGKGAPGVQDWGPAMGINWIPTRKFMAQAVPPAYTRYIGAHWILKHEPRT